MTLIPFLLYSEDESSFSVMSFYLYNFVLVLQEKVSIVNPFF